MKITFKGSMKEWQAFCRPFVEQDIMTTMEENLLRAAQRFDVAQAEADTADALAKPVEEPEPKPKPAPEPEPEPEPELPPAAIEAVEAPTPPATVPAKRGRGRPRKAPPAVAAETAEAIKPAEVIEPVNETPKVTVMGLELPADRVTLRSKPKDAPEQTEPDSGARLSSGQQALIDAGLMPAPKNPTADRVSNIGAQVAFEFDRVAQIYGAPAARQISAKALPDGVKFLGLEKLSSEFMPQVLSALRART